MVDADAREADDLRRAGHRSKQQEKRAEGDPVPGEGREAVPGDVAQERLDHDDRRDERHQEADGEGRRVGRAESAPALEQVVERRGEHDGNREEERELGRRAAGEAQRVAAHDRGARAGGARNQRQHLRQTDAERGRRRHIVHGRRPARAGASRSISRMSRPPTTSADRDHRGREQPRLDPVVGQEPDDRGRQEGDHAG